MALTRRELEVLDYLTGGLTPKEIAVELGISRSTERTHRANAYRKLDVKSRADAVAAARGPLAAARHRAGLLHAETEMEAWPLTPAQTLYLQAFDRFLRAKAEERRRARLEMRFMLAAMCVERQIPMPARKQNHALKLELPDEILPQAV